MRTIAVVTVGRSDYGISKPILDQIRHDPSLRLQLIVAGGHLAPEFGLTVGEIESDGVPIDERVEMLLSSDTAGGLAKSMGLGIIGFAQAFERLRPDVLVLVGDRYEMHAAAAAALPFRLPVAHVHGGESSEGAIDEALRHSMTKMSHLHFAATDVSAARIVQMGEEPWRVTVSGAPSLDNLRVLRLMSRHELERLLHVDLTPPVLLVTYHPVTLELEDAETQIGEVLAALAESQATVIVTFPNVDARARSIRGMLEAFVAQTPRSQLVTNLGTRAYFSLMQQASAMVGNSSSGIIEAASFKLPVVDVGNRQRGRLRADNVISVNCDRREILRAIGVAASPAFRKRLADLVNPYGDGHAAERIVARLKEVALDARLVMKSFHDLHPHLEGVR